MEVTTKRIEFEDIGYSIVATTELVNKSDSIWCVHFEVQEKGHDPSRNGTPQRPFLTGHVKWDGCSNWQPPTEGLLPWHFCSVASAENVGKLFRRMYEIAAEMMPENDFDEELEAVATPHPL